MQSLGDRIKKYEKVFNFSAIHRLPVMIRVDGRAFHTFTKNCIKPFDEELIKAMVRSAIDVAKEMQGFKVGYIQSDEATFCLTDYDTINSQGWFDYDISKMVSISASIMSVAFNNYYPTIRNPVFDSRAFTVPIDDVVNAFLWRAKDWERNSLQMYCRKFFSHKQLEGKKHKDMHEMLYKIKKNWITDLNDQEKNGTFIISKEREIEIRTDILPTYESISKNIEYLFYNK